MDGMILLVFVVFVGFANLFYFKMKQKFYFKIKLILVKLVDTQL
jgi:hypothetical protein